MHESFDCQRFECQCSSFHHNFRMILDKEEGDVYVDLHLNTYLPWYKRLWRAVVYVFRPGKTNYGHYDEVILEPKDYDRIIEMLNRSKEVRKRYEEKIEADLRK